MLTIMKEWIRVNQIINIFYLTHSDHKIVYKNYNYIAPLQREPEDGLMLNPFHTSSTGKHYFIGTVLIVSGHSNTRPCIKILSQLQ